MIALDATFLVGYLDGDPAAGEFIEDRRDRPCAAPSHALYEAYRGGARTAGRDGVERVAEALDWIGPLPFDESAAREAALVEAELRGASEPITAADIVIAGTCRSHGAALVTRDEDFERVADLETIAY